MREYVPRRDPRQRLPLQLLLMLVVVGPESMWLLALRVCLCLVLVRSGAEGCRARVELASS